MALEQGSDFRQGLAKILPGRTTITIWVYPDGFEAFRQIRKELYRLNYVIAARPLPPGASDQRVAGGKQVCGTVTARRDWFNIPSLVPGAA